ncbi:MAG: LysR substrate-binding domain-containing protein [Thermodesulfobacteriota bacterium]
MFSRLPSPFTLRTFESAARLGSFKAAAKELFVTPAAVSHQIRTLESQLNILLFVRKIRSIELTDAGKELAPILTRAFLDIRNGIDHIVSLENVINITTTSSFATLRLVPKLAELYASNPNYTVQLETTTKPIDLRQDRRVDIAIRYGHGPYEDLDTTTLISDTYGAYISPNLLPLKQGISEMQFIETAWQQDVLKEIKWQTWLNAASIKLDNPKIVRFSEEEHVLQAAIAGQGIALASSTLVVDFVKRNLLAPYKTEIQLVGGTYTILCLPDQRQVDKVRTFVSWLVKAFSN